MNTHKFFIMIHVGALLIGGFAGLQNLILDSQGFCATWSAFDSFGITGTNPMIYIFATLLWCIGLTLTIPAHAIYCVVKMRGNHG